MATAKDLQRQRLLLVLGLLAGPLTVFALARFPPTADSWYPGCMFHRLTGLHCPGCGATRCVHALLNGRLLQAVAYNPLLLALLPVLAYAGVRWAIDILRGIAPPARLLPAWTSRVVIVVVLAFWLARNLPWHPFSLLAPHELAPPVPAVVDSQARSD